MAYAELRHTADGQTHIEVETTWNEKELIKLVPGSRWDADGRSWSVPLGWAQCIILRGVFGSQVTFGDELTGWGWNELNTRVNPTISLRLRTEPTNELRKHTSPFDSRLYDFQRVGAQFMDVAGDCLLGDEMGTGKTIQALAALGAEVDALPALVVCPNSVKLNWEREVREWYPDAEPIVVAGTAGEKTKQLKRAAELPNAIVIINFEALRSYSRLAPYGSTRLTRCRECDKAHGDPRCTVTRCEIHLKVLNELPFKTVIVDEAHKMKDPKSKQTRACWAVMHGETVRRRWALTGTPLANHPGDLWSIMHGVAPYEYPSRTKFVDRYCTPPDSMVWMADGTFKQIGAVQVGDLVMGFVKEPILGKGKHPHYEPTRVLAVNRRTADLVRVHTTRGDSFLCTPDHKWLTGYRRVRRNDLPRTAHGNGPRVPQFDSPHVGMTMRHLITVPEPLPDELREDAAWLGGLYDGEGTHTRIAQSRVANSDVHEKIGQVLDKLGLPHRTDDFGHYLLGGRDTYFKFVHWCRPIKRYLASRSERYPWAGYLFRGNISGSGRHNSVTITNVQPAGHGEVVSLTTEHQTYVVHGYASHNCLSAWNAYGGLDIVGVNPATRDELFRFLDPRFRRMPKALVLTQLPPKVRQWRHVEMTPRQAKAYREMESSLITKLADGELLVAPNNLAAQTRLLQLSSSYCTLEPDPDALMGVRVTLTEPSPKLDALEEIMEELGDKPLVACAESKQLINMAARRMERAGVPHGLITGDQSQWEREQNLRKFQAGELRILLFTIQAGGVGLTMTAADTIVFLQRSWSMVANKQAEDRVHRIGSEVHESINVIDVITRGTVEERQVVRLYDKLQRLEEITRDRATLTLHGQSVEHLDAEEARILSSNLGVL